jgi:hypothetical protein
MTENREDRLQFELLLGSRKGRVSLPGDGPASVCGIPAIVVQERLRLPRCSMAPKFDTHVDGVVKRFVRGVLPNEQQAMCLRQWSNSVVSLRRMPMSVAIQ